jgi:peptidoglycan-associated lipoprotein
MTRTVARIVTPLLLVGLLSACGKKPPTVQPPAQPPAPAPATQPSPTPPTQPPAPPAIPSNPTDVGVTGKPLDNVPIEEINKNSPFKPVFFALDADTVDDEGRKVLEANAMVLKDYPTWVITIEGHADERGTSEYNLALGERRALAAKNYLLTLGIPAERLRTVSYGKEFPFNPGHDETAWADNRRAHFMLTSKQ